MVNKRHIDSNWSRYLIIAVMGALTFGTVMIYNATAVYSFGVFGGAYRFLILQVSWAIIGLIGFAFFYNFDYRQLSKYIKPVFFGSLFFLSLTAFAGILRFTQIIPCSDASSFTPCVNGATRWLYINPAPLPRLPLVGLLGFQPGEIVKLTMIVYLAFILANISKENNKPFIWFLIICGGVSTLLMLQPNMSTAALFIMIGSAMYFSSGYDLKPFFVLIPVGILLGIMFILLSPYRRERLFTFLGHNDQKTETEGYHIKQIQIALGSGGVTGVGFGQSRQKFQYLPEVSADSIFAVIGEELGLVGTVAILILFGSIFFLGIKIAENTHDLFGRLIAVGITSWIGLQFFINIAAMTKIIPLTGVPIPLISYGGSSLVFSLMGLGILANIGRNV